jgi:hypothetical protein
VLVEGEARELATSEALRSNRLDFAAGGDRGTARIVVRLLDGGQSVEAE